MIQVCIMGGHEGPLRQGRSVYLTFMGSCELIQPTIARRILNEKQQQREGLARRRPFFVTIMGATEVKVPTLAEEFLDLREMVSSGTLSMEEWDRAVTEIGRSEASIGSFTLMGALEESQLPSDEKEIDSLALQRHLGNIPESAGQILQYGVGQRDAERRATVRRAVLDAY